MYDLVNQRSAQFRAGRADTLVSALFALKENLMVTTKPFKTIEEQIEVLKSRNLVFLDEETAKNALTRYGYYEIINGYKDHFLIEKGSDEKGFKDGTTFEHIYALYNLDKNISRDILRALEDFEQTFKQSLAYVIAENISENDSKYCAKSHFNTGKTYGKDKNGNVRSDRTNLIQKFDRIKHSKNDPFKHYSINHGNIPPWIMIKGLTFGQSLYWYKLSKPDIRHEVIIRLLGIKILPEDIKPIYQLYGDIFSLYLHYRNLSAHGARIYNNRSNKHMIRKNPLLYNSDKIKVSNRDFSKGKYRSSIGLVILTLSTFNNQTPALLAYRWIIAELKEYLQKYPDDKDFLIKSMELELIPHTNIDLK